ncbi:hypothetical protein B0H11DRAFT_2226760 [Mycena galericulata]|nr:hypothetical protein B0H11DRAFT_2226760 [Mycena galericulata]
MPYFSSSSGAQVHGGNFYDIAGDMNVRGTPFLARQDSRELVLGRNGPERQILVPNGTGGQTAARMSPYDISQRPQNPTVVPGAFPEGLDSLSSRMQIRFRNSFSSIPRPSPPARVFESPVHDSTTYNGGVFISAGGSVNHMEHHGDSALHILHRASAVGAFHDSAERYPPPKCHPDTRNEILDRLWNWASETECTSNILWLYGPAGAGKSAIAQSFCEELQLADRLGGCFFFKRGHPSRGNNRKLVATIAYQLALLKDISHARFKDFISARMEEDPSILNRDLPRQLQELIIGPWSQMIREAEEIGNTPSTSAMRRVLSGEASVIVIDGLDECDDQAAQQAILSSIGRSIHESALPIRVLIASRPEPHLDEIFRRSPLLELHRSLNIRQSFEDVKKFLLHEFTRIHAEHHETMVTVPPPWPSSEVIDELVETSSGYFVYASTVIKFIDDKNFRPTERLAMIMGLVEPDFGLPFAGLDMLYIQILSIVPRRSRVLQILTVMSEGLGLQVDHIEQLFGLQAGDVRLALRGLHSLIHIPEETTGILTAHHASLYDFLHDSARSGPFCIGTSQHRTSLAGHIAMAYSYRNNNPVLNRSGHVSQ